MEDQILKISIDLLAVLIPLFVGFLTKYVKDKLGTENLIKLKAEFEAKKIFAMVAVQFVEQVYNQLDGPQKYEKAAEWLTARLNEKGMNFTQEEIRGLIESALRIMKDSFGEEWAKIGDQKGRF